MDATSTTESNETRLHDPYDDIILAEVAMEVINRARALVIARSYEVEADAGPDSSEDCRLRQQSIQLYALLRTISYREPAKAQGLIDLWGPLVRNEERFWKEIQDQLPAVA